MRPKLCVGHTNSLAPTPLNTLNHFVTMDRAIRAIPPAEFNTITPGTKLMAVCNIAVSKMCVGETGTLFPATALEVDASDGKVLVRYDDWGRKYDAWLTNTDARGPQVFVNRRDARPSSPPTQAHGNADAHPLVAQATLVANELVASATAAAEKTRRMADDSARCIVMQATAKARQVEQHAQREITNTVVELAFQRCRAESALNSARAPHNSLLVDNKLKRRRIEHLVAKNTHLQRELNRRLMTKPRGAAGGVGRRRQQF